MTGISGSGGFLESALGGIGKLFGVGNSGSNLGTSASRPMYVVDVSNTGSSALRNVAGADGGGLSGIVSSLGSALSSAFSGLQSFGRSAWSGISSIGSSISDLFAGFFANGGTIPAGQFGVVGEAGPEFISGPAQITPMSGSTNVTYNINAVDALSFKQLLAQDPSFLYAVTQQGAKSIPGRR
jgi:hypothetical protein